MNNTTGTPLLSNERPVALVTGASQRLGAATASKLHEQGFDIIIHFRNSQPAAESLVSQFNNLRAASACCIQADLQVHEAVLALAENVKAVTERLTVLVNNASAFYPTPIGQGTEAHWNELFASNAKAPYFLIQELKESLAKNQGCVVNMVDIYATRPLDEYSIYTMAKSSLLTLTRALAKELAPDVRVNGVAPGCIMWPDSPESMSEESRKKVLASIPLGRIGSTRDIADTIYFLTQATYITGQIIAVDGGSSL